MPVLAKLLETIEQVPPLSAAALRLLRLQGQPDRSMNEIVQIVEVDAGLTVAVLKASNSAAALPAQPITSVRQALTYLGERMVLALAIAACVPGGMTAPIDGYQGERGALWRHSLRAAMAARELSTRARYRVDSNLAFTAGILHDIGKPVLSTVLGAEGRQALAEAALRREADFGAVERALAGMSHPEVGEALARRWGLPAALQVAIRHHHEPAQSPEDLRALSYVVHVGVMHSVLTGHACGVDDLCYRLDTGMLSVFDLSVVDFGALMERVDRTTAEAQSRVGEP
ncbi:MAG: HDOD domain-containing protein [Deltaproteobacteria bacterium]|nr:HDOD domain-containing protein [Deltaproteobacteria bacterium]